MPVASIAGISTHYQMIGEGPPLMVLEPEGFDSAMSRRRLTRLWRGFQPVETLPRDFRVITYDRRESGKSGGRIEPLTWEAFARHARDLLDHLEIADALVLGGCIGCSVGLAFAANFPERCRGLLLHWPVGGFRWLSRSRENFDRHIAFARECGLAGVVERARQSEFLWNHLEAGPWSSVIASDAAFAQSFIRQDLDRYLQIAGQSRDSLFNDTMPSGATGTQLMAMAAPVFIMPGNDASHSASCAQILHELIPQATLSALGPRQQNAASIEQWIYSSIGMHGPAQQETAA